MIANIAVMAAFAAIAVAIIAAIVGIGVAIKNSTDEGRISKLNKKIDEMGEISKQAAEEV
jgi:hypothetical protein